MHNRHFIINMVINGEKAPAFSATTLQLPPVQMDNTAKIVENTRRYYSRSRAEVEVEIANAIAIPDNLQQKPKSHAQAKQGPIDSGAQAVQATQTPADPSSTQQGSGEAVEAPVKPKRKRTRSRKRKTSPSEEKTPE